MSFRPMPRLCRVCGADLSARKEPVGWRLPPQLCVTFDALGGKRKWHKQPRQQLCFCIGCVSGNALSVAVDSMLEKGTLR